MKMFAYFHQFFNHFSNEVVYETLTLAVTFKYIVAQYP